MTTSFLILNGSSNKPYEKNRVKRTSNLWQIKVQLIAF